MADGRGGSRLGRPGQSYANRSDLNGPVRTQPVRAAPGQTYGERGAQEEQQRQAPLPLVPPPKLTDPTRRPDEPVTAGAPLGPGPGPEALGLPAAGAVDDVLEQLRALYLAEPNEHLRLLIEEAE